MKDEILRIFLESKLSKKEFLKEVMLTVDDKKEFGTKSCYVNVGKGYDNCFGVFKRTRHSEENMPQDRTPIQEKTLVCLQCKQLKYKCSCK